MTIGHFGKGDIMPSDNVKKILSAEAEAERLTAAARERCEEVVRDARQKAAVAIQKKISQANTEADKIRSANQAALAEYREKAEADCRQQVDTLQKRAADNSEKAVDAIISRFFS